MIINLCKPLSHCDNWQKAKTHIHLDAQLQICSVGSCQPLTSYWGWLTNPASKSEIHCVAPFEGLFGQGCSVWWLEVFPHTAIVSFLWTGTLLMGWSTQYWIGHGLWWFVIWMGRCTEGTVIISVGTICKTCNCLGLSKIATPTLLSKCMSSCCPCQFWPQTPSIWTFAIVLVTGGHSWLRYLWSRASISVKGEFRAGYAAWLKPCYMLFLYYWKRRIHGDYVHYALGKQTSWNDSLIFWFVSMLCPHG